jgi:hypothetical protein
MSPVELGNSALSLAKLSLRPVEWLSWPTPNMEHARKTARHRTDTRYSAFAYPLNVTCLEWSRELVAENKKQYGRLDVCQQRWVDPKFDLDAGSKGNAFCAFADYPLDQRNAPLNVNLTGIFSSHKLVSSR